MTGKEASVEQAGGAVVIRGDALGPLYRCVLAGVREARRNGYPIGPFIALQAATLAAHRAKSDVGHENSNSAVDQSESGCQGDDDSMLSIAEAAALSGFCERQVRRRARSGLGRRIGSTWVLTRGAALALKAEREWKAENGSRRIPRKLETAASQASPAG